LRAPAPAALSPAAPFEARSIRYRVSTEISLFV
jgi:hypothetical protein